AGTLQIGAGGATGAVAGAIVNSGTVVFNRSDDLTAGGAITGAGALEKRGAGTLTLIGANSAGAGTTISAGTLALGGGVTLASNVEVKSGATLQGATDGTAGGTIIGTVTIADGGTLRGAPSTAGTHALSMTTLVLSGGANVDVVLGAATGGGVISAENLTLDGVLNVANGGSMAQGVYRIIDYTTMAANNGLVLGSTPGDYAYEIQLAPGQVNLAVLSGEMLYWNGTTTSPDGTIQGGAGTWTANTAETNWLTSTLNQSRAWNSGFAAFAGTAGEVTIDGTVSAIGLQFMVDGYSVSGGTLTLAATSGKTPVRVGDGTADGAGYTATIGAVLAGTTGLEKTDLGTLILTGTNTYEGGTTVSAGTLQIGSGGTTGSISGDVAVAASATLSFNRTDLVTFAGDISGAGALTQKGSGTLILTGASSYAGGTTISAGTLKIGAGGATGSIAGNITNNAALAFDRSDDLTFAGAISGSGSFTKAGTGTLTLAGTNSFSGATTVAAGTLALTGGASLADGARLSIETGATLSLGDADETVGSLAGAGTLALGSHTLTAGGDGTTSTFSGALTGTGGLTKTGAGTLTLSGSNGAGRLRIDAGTLVAVGTGALADGSAVTVSAGATLDLQMSGTKALGALSGAGSVQMNAASLTAGSANSSTTFSGVLSGSGGFGKTGTGTLTLSGANTYTGTTTVAGGTLALTGSVAGGAVVADGATLSGDGTVAGTVQVLAGGTLAGAQANALTMGGLNLQAGATVSVALGQTTAGDVFTVNGDVTLDGTLSVTQGAGFGAGVYRFISYTGSLTDNGMNVAPLTGGLAGGVQTSVAGEVNLIVEGAGAPIQFWNGSTTTPSQSVEGGNGTWTAGLATNWTNASGTIAQAWNGGFAVFQGTDGTVTVDNGSGQVSVTGMQFVTSGYLVTGGSIQLTGTEKATIRVGDGTEAGASTVATIASALTGTAGLEKTDLGTLILTGASTYEGGTIISAGTLQIGDGGTTGSILGNVTNNAALVFNLSADTSFAGAISGTGTLAQMGTGTL
ncbi:MAG: histidine kinase, partial [Ancylobacter novellus]